MFPSRSNTTNPESSSYPFPSANVQPIHLNHKQAPALICLDYSRLAICCPLVSANFLTPWSFYTLISNKNQFDCASIEKNLSLLYNPFNLTTQEAIMKTPKAYKALFIILTGLNVTKIFITAMA